MVQARLTAIALIALAAMSCSPRMSWEKHIVDGHRTGVTSVIGSDITDALGMVDEEIYYSPNGNAFNSGSTPAAASILLSVQPQMSYLKEVLGHSPAVMGKGRPESELGNWAVDAMMKGVETITGRKVDFGVVNVGGIRLDMPAGDVLLDDIVSMFPFHNYLCYLSLKGSDIRALLAQMAAGKMEAVGGVVAEVVDGKLVSAVIDGSLLDDDRIYGVATLDFLLDGGDGLSVARNAKELIITDVLMKQWMTQYVRSLTEAGKEVEYSKDGRVKVL